MTPLIMYNVRPVSMKPSITLAALFFFYRYEDSKISIKAVWLKHRIPSYGFVIEETPLPGRLVPRHDWLVGCLLFYITSVIFLLLLGMIYSLNICIDVIFGLNEAYGCLFCKILSTKRLHICALNFNSFEKYRSFKLLYLDYFKR